MKPIEPNELSFRRGPRVSRGEGGYQAGDMGGHRHDRRGFLGGSFLGKNDARRGDGRSRFTSAGTGIRRDSS